MPKDKDIYCSLASAKRFKELGVAQESKEFYSNRFDVLFGEPEVKWSAFSEEELDRLLPAGTDAWQGTYNGQSGWIVWSPIDWSTTFDERLIEAKAKMLRRILGDSSL